MPIEPDDHKVNGNLHSAQSTEGHPRDAGYRATWLRLPGPVKRLFDHFPRITYDRNELPRSRINLKNEHTLCVFTTAGDAERGRPSFNPTCLKWQAYLRFCDIEFRTCPSSNHAAPTGALPFLLPSPAGDAPSPPISAARLIEWARETGPFPMPESHDDMRHDAYMSLLDHRLRNAYLYALFLCSGNFAAITQPLYVNCLTSNNAVRLALAHKLREAARSELLKQLEIIDAASILRECAAALEALSTLLGENSYFSGSSIPGLFDAAVFAYTNFFLNEDFAWDEKQVPQQLQRHGSLLDHRERILEEFFP